MFRNVMVLAVLILFGCASTAGATNSHVEGFARYAGELLIFDSPNPPPDDLTNNPRCISAVPSKSFHDDLRKFDKRHVLVVGHFVNYDQLQNEGGARGQILPRKVVDGFVVSNFCRNPKVLVIDSVVEVH